MQTMMQAVMQVMMHTTLLAYSICSRLTRIWLSYLALDDRHTLTIAQSHLAWDATGEAPQALATFPVNCIIIFQLQRAGIASVFSEFPKITAFQQT